MKLTVLRMILFIVIEVIILLIAAAVFAAQLTFHVPPDTPPKYGEQVVLVVDRMLEDSKKHVTPQGTITLTLSPLAGPTAKAPLKPGDFLLCRPFDMRDQEGGMHVAVKCGDDTYLVSAFGLHPLK